MPNTVPGPVRGICFHSQQPLFVSGGDDYKIKVIQMFSVFVMFCKINLFSPSLLFSLAPTMTNCSIFVTISIVSYFCSCT